MRNLSKHSEPVILQQNAATWLSEYLADLESATKRFRYRHADIKAALRSETASKCVYCESKVGHNTPGDIEHKVPSQKNRNLHFRWDNLTLACTECNRRKNDYYERGQEFLDPYSDNVESLLIHLGPLVYSTPGNPRAEITVRILELDSGSRAALFDRKKDVLEKARALLEAVAAAHDGDILKLLRKDEVSKMCQSDAEFSAMVKSYVEPLIAPGGVLA